MRNNSKRLCGLVADEALDALKLNDVIDTKEVLLPGLMDETVKAVVIVRDTNYWEFKLTLLDVDFAYVCAERVLDEVHWNDLS